MLFLNWSRRADFIGYELRRRVEDKYLVDYRSIETKLKFMNEGIVYDELSEEEKKQYEKLFTNENGEIPPALDSSALNEWIFNKDTIKQVLNILLTKVWRQNYSDSVGKTIIFAKNHPARGEDFGCLESGISWISAHCKAGDNYTNYARKETCWMNFPTGTSTPQILVSVDMLDTGIDVPEILNLVFLRKLWAKRSSGE